MTAAAVRTARHLSLAEIGIEGQERISRASVLIAGSDLLAETVARTLAACGVGRLVMLARSPAPEGLRKALLGSNPTLALQEVAWPGGGPGWVSLLEHATLAARIGFDDDAMLPAAVRTGTPLVCARAGASSADVVAFSRHGPCPHLTLQVAERASAAPSEPVNQAPDRAGQVWRRDAPSVVAGTLAAAEALLILAGAIPLPRARMISVDLEGGEPRSARIPWAPECFACGGNAQEMTLA